MSSLVGSMVLLIALKGKIGSYLKGFFGKFLKGFVASVFMGASVLIASDLIKPIFSGGGIIDRLMSLAIPVIIGVLVYGVMLIILKVDIVTEFISKFKKR